MNQPLPVQLAAARGRRAIRQHAAAPAAEGSAARRILGGHYDAGRAAGRTADRRGVRHQPGAGARGAARARGDRPGHQHPAARHLCRRGDGRGAARDLYGARRAGGAGDADRDAARQLRPRLAAARGRPDAQRRAGRRHARPDRALRDIPPRRHGGGRKPAAAQHLAVAADRDADHHHDAGRRARPRRDRRQPPADRRCDRRRRCRRRRRAWRASIRTISSGCRCRSGAHKNSRRPAGAPPRPAPGFVLVGKVDNCGADRRIARCRRGH